MRKDRRALVLVGVALVMATGLALWWRSTQTSPLSVALARLRQAAELDAQLEAANDPAPLASQRDALLDDAKQRLKTILARHPGLPEAELGLAQAIWRADNDLTEAWRHVSLAIDGLAKLPPAKLARRLDDGRSGAQVLAAAYAERAGYLLARLGTSEPDDPIARHSLQQAGNDLKAAIALDPQERYQSMLAGLGQMSAGQGQPFDPRTLTQRPAAK